MVYMKQYEDSHQSS